MKHLKLAIALLFIPFVSFAWHDGGHMTAGAVAYYYLKQNNPAVLQRVLVSFQAHPWYNTTWAEKMKGLTQEQKDVAVFMLASTWPDDARKDPDYGGAERAKWHYINYPVVASGFELKNKELPSPNAEERLNTLIDSLKLENDTKEKAVNLCWLFHITEDIHQPLHTVALFDEQHPTGDRGGNDTYIRLSDSAAATRLHSYWDGLVPGTLSNIPAKAQALLAEKKYQPANLPELAAHKKISDWITKEGVTLATTTVYRNTTVNGTETNPTRVDATYIAEAKVLGEKRVVLSGIRLAKELIQIYTSK